VCRQSTPWLRVPLRSPRSKGHLITDLGVCRVGYRSIFTPQNPALRLSKKCQPDSPNSHSPTFPQLLRVEFQTIYAATELPQTFVGMCNLRKNTIIYKSKANRGIWGFHNGDYWDNLYSEIRRRVVWSMYTAFSKVSTFCFLRQGNDQRPPKSQYTSRIYDGVIRQRKATFEIVTVHTSHLRSRAPFILEFYDIRKQQRKWCDVCSNIN